MAVAYVMINCDLGKEEIVIKNLKQLSCVKEVHGTFGVYDIFTKVEDSEMERLREAITQSIRKTDFIRSTITLMGIEGQN